MLFLLFCFPVLIAGPGKVSIYSVHLLDDNICFLFLFPENKSQSNIYAGMENLGKVIKVENHSNTLQKNIFNLLFQCQCLWVRESIVSSRKEKAVPLSLKWENHWVIPVRFCMSQYLWIDPSITSSIKLETSTMCSVITMYYSTKR